MPPVLRRLGRYPVRVTEQCADLVDEPGGVETVCDGMVDLDREREQENVSCAGLKIVKDGWSTDQP